MWCRQCTYVPTIPAKNGNHFSKNRIRFSTQMENLITEWHSLQLNLQGSCADWAHINSNEISMAVGFALQFLWFGNRNQHFPGFGLRWRLTCSTWAIILKLLEQRRVMKWCLLRTNLSHYILSNEQISLQCKSKVNPTLISSSTKRIFQPLRLDFQISFIC